MANQGRITILFFIFLFFGHTHADPCSAVCSGGASSKGGYQKGSSYNYAVEGNAKVYVTAADKQETTLKITAGVTVFGLGNCANILKVTSLEIKGPDGKAYTKPREIEKPVRFVLQDGVLNGNICAEPEDTRPSLNIKRAIISMLQFNKKSTTEVDVFGVCPTNYEAEKEGIFVKSRDLNSCSKREQGEYDFLAVMNPSATKSSNILDSTLKVNIQTKNGVVEKADAQEDYLYVPFATGSSGAKASVSTKIFLKSTSKGSVQAKCVEPRTVIFENPLPLKTEHSNVVNIQLALKTVSQSLADKVDSKSASAFAGLVRMIRVSSKDDLNNIYNQIKGGSAIKNNNLARRIFLDALFRAGTGDTVEVTLKLIQSKELSELEESLALVSLTTSLHASSDAIKSAITLLDNSKLPNEVYLGVGSLAGAYCRSHKCHGAGSQDPAIAQLSAKLGSKIGNCKANNKKDENTIIFALKAIKNIKHIEDNVVDKLVSCASDKSVHTRVRVAAIETFIADPCISKLKGAALDILKDTQQDSEIRIKAYLALVNCPCNKVAAELKTLLETETINQVGSFITSSLKNIKASANPAREAAKKYFGSISTSRKFPLDVRKFSQNYEMSYEHDMFGIGSVVDSNVIYSQNSYMPRSASLNLTTEIFGRNVNLLEFGFRQGNLDRMMERYFGPHGEINTHTPQQIFSEIKKRSFEIFDKVKERMEKSRGKRSVARETGSFAKQLKTDLQHYYGDLDMDVFISFLGSETIFLSLGDGKETTVESFIDKFFDYVDSGVDKAKDFSHEIRSHMLLLDVETGYPTAAGIALKLNLEAASTSRMEFSTNCDIKKIMNDPSNAKIDIKFIPSANIEVSGNLMFDADVVATGLRVQSTMHTSTGSHLIAQILDSGKGFDVKLGLPLKKQEVVSVDYDIVFITRPKGQQESEKELNFEKSDKQQFKGCFDQLSSIIGLTFCGDISLPWKRSDSSVQSPVGPLSGPAKFSVSLEKEDLTGYHITGHFTDKKTEKKVQVMLETEGGKARKIDFIADYINSETVKSVKVSLAAHTEDKFEAEITLRNDVSEMTFLLRTLLGKDEYSAKIGLLTSSARQQQIMKPIFSIKAPGETPTFIELEGQIIKERQAKHGEKYTAKGLRLKSNENVVQIDGWLIVDEGVYQTDLKLAIDKQSATIAGKFSPTSDGFSSNWNFHNTINPDFDFSLESAVKLDENTQALKLSLVHGKDFNSKTNKIVFETKLSSAHLDDISAMSIEYSSKFSYALWEIKYDSEFEIKPKKYKGNLNAQYEKSKLELLAEVQHGMKSENDFYGKLKTKVNDKGFDGEFKYIAVSATKGNYECKVLMYPGGKFDASGSVSYQMLPDDVNIGFSIKCKIPDKSGEYKFDSAFVHNVKVLNAHTKASIGNANYVDFVMNIQKGNAPNGNIKIFFKGFLQGDGTFKINAKDHKGNGAFLVELLKTGRKIKMDGTFLINKPQYNANVDLFLNFNKDNNDKVTFSTTTKWQKESIDTKNSILCNKRRVDFNVKGDYPGTFTNGKQNGQASLSLSDGPTITINLDREMKMSDDNDMLGQISLDTSYAEKKGATPYRTTFKAKVNTFDKIDFEQFFTFTKPSGDKFNYKFNGKKFDKAERTIAEAQMEMSGSLSPNTINAFVSCDFNKDIDENQGDVKYRAKGSYGPKSTLDASGTMSYDLRDDEDNSFKSDSDIAITIPLEKPQNIKFVSSESIFVPKGADSLELKSLSSVQINADTYKYDSDFTIGEKQGKGRLLVLVPHKDKFLVEGSYSEEAVEGSEQLKYGSGFNLEYGADQKFSVSMAGTRTPGKEGHFVTNIALPSDFKRAKKVVTDLKYKHTGSTLYSSEYVFDIDGQKSNVAVNMDFVDIEAPMFEVKGSCHDQKPFRVFIKANGKDKNSVRGEAQFLNIGDFNLDMNIDAKLQSADQFTVKVYIDCAKLSLKKLQFEAINEALSKGAKKIQFNAKEDNKNLLSGTTTYQSRQEGDKFTMEGSGSFKLRDQQKQTSFKYVRDKLSDGKERGVDVLFTVAMGGNNVAIEYRNTNLVYKLNNAYCEENKQCAYINILSKTDDLSVSRYVEEFEFSFDLTKFGFVPELSIQRKTELENFRLPTTSFDMNLVVSKSKYRTKAFAKPEGGFYLTGFSVSMPKRTISLESQTTYPDPRSKASMFPFVSEINFYTNKIAEPNAKTTLLIKANLDKDTSKSLTTSGEISLSSPCLEKSMQITGKSTIDVKTYALNSNLVLDIFKKKQQKILVNVKYQPTLNDNSIEELLDVAFNADGLGFNIALHEKLFLSMDAVKFESRSVLNIGKQQNRVAEIVLDLNKNEQKFSARVPSTEIVNYVSSIKYDSGNLKTDATVCWFQDKTTHYTLEAFSKPGRGFKITIKPQGAPQTLLISGNVEIPKKYELRAELLEGNKKKTLAHMGITSDGKAVKHDNGMDGENIKGFIKYMGDEIISYVKLEEKVSDEVRDQTVKDVQTTLNLLKGGVQDVKVVEDYIMNELKKVRSELEADKAIQQYVKSANEYIEATVKALADFMQKAINITQEVVTLVTETSGKLLELFNERILPELSDIYGQCSMIASSLIQAAVDIATHYITVVADFFDRHAAEFKPLIEAINSIISDFNKIVVKKFEEFVVTLEAFCEEIKAQWNDLPIVSTISDQLNELSIPTLILTAAESFNELVKPILPTEELEKFLDTVVKYLQKKANKEKCNDGEEIQAIMTAYFAAVESVTKYIQTQLESQDTQSILGLFAPVQPASFNFLNNLPKPSSPSLSPFNYLSNEQIPDPEELFKAYRPTSLNPLDAIPPLKLQGIIAGGQHIFTFDGRHLTFPGNCKYVVSQDALDGNFSIVITLDKGNAKAITLTDKSGSEIEINNKGQLSLNNNNYGFPVVKADTLAWKEPDSYTIMSKYGARVRCSLNLDLCYFEISGYYTARLRGLLGDGNNEPSDDFRLPNGVITKSEADFGNSYGLGSCGKVKTVDHSHHAGHESHASPDDACEIFFGKDSEFHLCDIAVNIDNYKQACQHATMGLSPEKTKKEACLIAKAYHLACESQAFFLSMPKACSKCEVDGEVFNPGQSFNVKSQTKKADIILAVETTKANEKTYKELVVPLMSQIVDELKAKKIDDVKVYLAGISPKLPYPIYYDITNNKLQGAHIDFKHEQRSAEWESPITTDVKELDSALNNITRFAQLAEIELGLNNIHSTYTRFHKVQFRPKASKSIIMVHSEPCMEAMFPLIQFVGREISTTLMTEKGIVGHLITPININAREVKQSSSIVGFSQNHVFLLADKKRGLSNSNLKASLNIGEDFCIDYAEDTYGNVYSSSHFFSCSGGQRKSYMTMMSNTIVDSIVGVSMESECKCDPGIFRRTPRVDCSVKSRKDNRKAGKKK